VSEALDRLVVRMPEGQTPQWRDDRSVGIGPIASVTELRPAMLVPVTGVHTARSKLA